MSNDQKWEVAVNLAAILPAVVREIPGAVDVAQKMWDALKGGITDDEWQAALAERDAVIEGIISSTAPAG